MDNMIEQVCVALAGAVDVVAALPGPIGPLLTVAAIGGGLLMFLALPWQTLEQPLPSRNYNYAEPRQPDLQSASHPTDWLSQYGMRT